MTLADVSTFIGQTTCMYTQIHMPSHTHSPIHIHVLNHIHFHIHIQLHTDIHIRLQLHINVHVHSDYLGSLSKSHQASYKEL